MTTDALARPRTSRPGLMEVAAGAVVYLFFYYAVAPAVARMLSADAAVKGLALAALSGLMGLAAFAAAYAIRSRRFPTFGLRRVTRRPGTLVSNRHRSVRMRRLPLSAGT